MFAVLRYTSLKESSEIISDFSFFVIYLEKNIVYFSRVAVA